MVFDGDGESLCRMSGRKAGCGTGLVIESSPMGFASCVITCFGFHSPPIEVLVLVSRRRLIDDIVYNSA